MKNVALHNLGCKVNAYEVDVMQQKLQENGYNIVGFDEKADIYIINTCSVTNMAERKSRQMLHRAKKKNPQAIVVAVGCYVQTKEQELMDDLCVDLIIGNNKKKELVYILDEFMSKNDEGINKTLNQTTVIDISTADKYEEIQLKDTSEHTRAYIKVQDGCNQFCTYCIIPYARGRVRSRKIADVYTEIEGLVKKGFKEIVITGIHISSYGIDFEESITLIDLIEKVQFIEGLERIRLGSLEPRIMTKEATKRLAEISKLCPHFHLSLQSGCDDTLQRMNRHYDTKAYAKCVDNLRNDFSHPAITTDVIVGFPGETDIEFQQTKEFIDKIKFYEIHVFKYSKRDGTKAAIMDNQVLDLEKSERSDQLIEQTNKLAYEFREYYLNKKEYVLIEETKEINGQVYQIGYTDTYLKVAILSSKDLKNQLIYGEIKKFLTQDILFMEYSS